MGNDQAGEYREKAISYSLVAIEQALQVYASEVAVKHYQLILDLLDERSDIAWRAWLLEELGNLYFQRTRQMLDAVAAYESAIQLRQMTPEADVPALIRLYRNMGEIARHWEGHIKRLDTYLAEALRLLDQNPTQVNTLERARVLTVMAF